MAAQLRTQPVAIKAQTMVQDFGMLHHTIGEQLRPRSPGCKHAGHPQQAAQPSAAAPCSKLTASLQSQKAANNGVCELESILQAKPPDGPAPFFGVSPPIRSGCCGGAANPLAKAANFSGFSTSLAYNASTQHLQALRALDSELSFLRQVGDHRLVLGSPEPRVLSDEMQVDVPTHVSAGGIWSYGLRTQQLQPLQQQQQQASKDQESKFAPFSCRAQYFAVR